MQPGTQLAHYQIVEKIGEGGMGVVYKARDLKLERFVALKVLPAAMLADLERVRRFEQEAKTASALNHPNIVTIHDIAEQDGVRFIVMEFIKGQTLDRLIPKGGMARAQALGFAVQVADAVAAAAASGVTHRDLKPGNIMVTETGLVKLLDFGLAKLTERVAISADDATVVATPKTKEGVIAGTVDYMSPEQAEGRAVDARSDIFSFGSVLYEMLSGGKPFAAATPMAVLGAIMHQEPTAIAGLPPELGRLLARAMRKDPARRFQTMADLRVALLDLKEDSASGLLAAPKQGSPWRNWVAAGTAVIVVSAGLGYLVSKMRWGAEPITEMKVTPLTALAGFERQPTFSPDGNQVAFSWEQNHPGAKSAIHVRMVRGGPTVRLTTGDQAERCPQWSSDGQWIAFTREDPVSKSYALFLLSPVSRQERKILDTGSASNGCMHGWHPNGQWLAVNLLGSDRGLHAVSLEDGRKHRLSSKAEGSASRPAFSPDAKWIAYTTNNGLRVLELDDNLKPRGEARTIVPASSGLNSIAWMPDGKEILFSASADGSRLYRISPNGGVPQPVQISGLGDDFTTFALGGPPSRLRLAVTQVEEQTSIWRQDLDGQGTGVGEPRKLFGTTRREDHPEWSPDASRIAFVSRQSGPQEVWLADAEGKDMTQLTSTGATTEFVYWSPDGSQILRGLLGVASRKVLELVSAGNGTIRQIRTRADASHALGWARDGKSVYFTSHESGKEGVWRVGVDGAAEERILEQAPHCGTESPDGRVYFFDWKDGIYKRPLSGGDPVRVVESEGMFSVTTTGIFYIAGRRRTESDVYFYDFASGRARLAFRFPGRRPPRSKYIAVSRDGRRAALVTSEVENSDLMLVENFR